ncbi:queuosine precursor transporter [Candidatus Woesearchaeota archaeon]|nr:queuosine precursor transporter [Candidatus Woesearchaeota archaeon]
MAYLIIILWILATLAVTSFIAVIGKRYGVEYIIALAAALTVAANILANKIVVFGPFTVPAGVIAFSMTFLLTDILSERWGKAYARKAVWAGFYANIVFVISLYIALAWTPAPFAAESASMFAEVLKLTPRLFLAGIVAYLISQHHDIWAFHFWKRVTKNRHLWFRNNASTIISQLLDSVIFIVIGFYGVFPVLPLILGQWVVKIIIALLDTPFMYLIVWLTGKPAKSRTRTNLRLA